MKKKTQHTKNHKDETFLEHVVHIEKDIQKKITSYRQSIFERMPFLFLTISTLGGVSVFYGFEKMIDRTPYLADNPLAILLFGFTLLIISGALFTKLR